MRIGQGIFSNYEINALIDRVYSLISGSYTRIAEKGYGFSGTLTSV